MALVEMESLFFTPMPSLLETPSRIQSANQNEFTEIVYEMVNITEHFETDFQEVYVSTAEKMDKNRTSDMGKCYGTSHSTKRRSERTSRIVTRSK